MSDHQGQQATPYDPAEPAEQHAPSGWRLGSLRGTPIYLGRSWPLLAVVVVATWAPGLQPRYGALAVLVALAYVLLLLVSVLAHEAAHALTAQAFGHRVHRIVADLMGGHTTYQSLTNTPARSALVAVSGPAANALLAGAGWALLPAAPPGLVRYLLFAFTLANGVLAVFNLLPGLPLDGGFVLDALVWRLTGSRTTGLAVAGWAGRGLVLVGAGWLLVRPLLAGSSPDLVSVMWLALLGSFLWMGASQAVRSSRARRLLDRVRVAELAHPTAVLAASATARDVVEVLASGRARAVAVCDEQDRPVAVVDPEVLRGVPADRLALTPALAVAAVQPQGWVVDLSPEQAVTDAVERMAVLDAPVLLARLPDGTAALLDAGEIEVAATRAAGGAH